MKTGTVRCRDIEIFYREAGQSGGTAGLPVMLMLHGNSEDSSFFVHQIDYFKDRFHIYALDTRAHGRSSRGLLPMNFRTLADDVLAFMNRLKLERAVLLGFSDGGNTALVFGLHYPGRVQAIIACGANLYPKGMKRAAYLGTLVVNGLLSLPAKLSARAFRRKEVWGLMVSHPRLSYERMKGLRVPVLSIVGEHDVIRELHTRKMTNAMPNARMEVIYGGDHFCASRMPETFNRIVEDFLKEIMGKAAFTILQEKSECEEEQRKEPDMEGANERR